MPLVTIITKEWDGSERSRVSVNLFSVHVKLTWTSLPESGAGAVVKLLVYAVEGGGRYR